ncbi:MAG: hypothetical protein IT379_08060, partial [Deltaproteobacteria bacterium]|nr:hypothetical protein [Deltaproteobacteria bacterium]
MLVAANLLTPERLALALETQAQDGRRLGDIVVSEGWVTEVQLVQVLSQQLSVPWVSLHHVDFSRQLLNLVPRGLAERYCLLPIYVRHVRGVGDTLYVAMDDPSNDEALATIEATAGLPVRPMIAPPSDIRSAIRVYYGGAPAPPPRSVHPPAAAAPAKRAPIPLAPPVPRDAVAAAPPPRAPPSAPAPPPQTPPAPAILVAASPPPQTPPPPSVARVEEAAPAQPEGERPSVEPLPLSRRRPGAPAMVTLTLLDGTTVQLPRTRP